MMIAMIASKLGDVALIVINGAAVLVAIALLVLVVGKRFRGADLKMGPLEVQLSTIQEQIEQVNKAVNNVPANTPTLVTRVGRTEEILRHLLVSVRIIAEHVGAELPELRDEDDDRRLDPNYHVDDRHAKKGEVHE